MPPLSTAHRLGVAAGLALVAMFGVLLFVGPWRVFALGGGEVFPIRVLDGGSGPFVTCVAGTLLVGFVTGSAYPMRVGEDEAIEWGELAMGAFVPPLATATLGFLLLMLAPAVGTLVAGAVGEAAVEALIGLVMTALFGGTLATVLSIYVGVPLLVGVFAGVRIGRAATPE